MNKGIKVFFGDSAIFKTPDPATLSNVQLLAAYSTSVLMLTHSKKNRKAQVDEYGKRLIEEILRRMEGYNVNSDEFARSS